MCQAVKVWSKTIRKGRGGKEANEGARKWKRRGKEG